MSLTFGFYNSINGDRVYDAIQMGQIFDGIITDGIYATYLKAMVVKASDNASEVIVQPGRAWFNHTWTYIDADYPVEAPAPEVILDRVDTLVLDINQEYSDRENKILWVTGTPASVNPTAPALINTTTHHQYPLCNVYRKAGTTMIYAADITNRVGTSDTPFVTGVLTGINIDDLLSQWDDEFHTWEASTKTSFEAWMLNQQSVYVTWFDSIKDQMEGDLTDFEAWFETIRGIIDEEAATHLQAEIDELKDMLPAGSHIDISTSESTLFNRNVTVSDGVHSKTVQFDSVGGATVESFPYIGIISVTSTDGTRTAEESINIPYFGRYSATLAFWSATVNLVGDESLAALPVTVRDSNGDVVSVVTLNASGQGVFTATKPDTYKFIYTYGGQTMETTLQVTQETTYEVEIHGGFNYQAWLTAGRVEEEFDTLDEILADEPTLRQLFLVHDSVDYICNTFSESATSAVEDITKIFNTDLAAKWINLSDYALDHFYAVPGIKSIMDTADKYGYGEWALVGQVPKMASNTAPFGVASASSAVSDYEAYKAFDGTASVTRWLTNGGVLNATLAYQFVNPIVITEVSIVEYAPNGDQAAHTHVDSTIYIEGSNDGTSWSDSLGSLLLTNENRYKLQSIKLNNSTAYTYYRIRLSGPNIYVSNTYYCGLCSVQFNKWAPKGNVPVMTSNTAPYGTAIMSRQDSGCEAYRAFDQNESDFWRPYNSIASNTDYIGYRFSNPICPKKVYIYRAAQLVQSYIIEASNDGVTWEAISDIISFSSSSETMKTIELDVSDFYLYLRLRHVSTTGTAIVAILSLQFYGRELKVSVPTMTSDTAPYGEASCSNAYAGNDAWKAFDNGTKTFWASRDNLVTNQWIQYAFTDNVVVKKMYLSGRKATSSVDQSPKDCIIKYSDDGTTFYDSNSITYNGNSAVETENYTAFDVTESNPHKIWRLHITNCQSSANLCAIYGLKFYGLDYSEKEFEVGTTKKWLYDHGVKVEISGFDTIGDAGTVVEDGYKLEVKKTNASSSAYVYIFGVSKELVDLTPYSHLFTRCDVAEGKQDGTNAPLIATAKTASYNLGNSIVASNFILNGGPLVQLNVSAINQSTYVGFGVGYNQSLTDTKVYELWLE